MPARSCTVLAFAVGLIMTLVVAWACALWSPVDEPLPKYQVDVAAIIVADSTPFDVDVVRTGFGYAEVGSTAIGSVDLETGQSWQMQSPIPVLVESSAGWPCLCLTRSEATGTNWIDQGIVIKEGTLGVINGRRIPLRPIWAGLAVNTAFFLGDPLVHDVGTGPSTFEVATFKGSMRQLRLSAVRIVNVSGVRSRGSVTDRRRSYDAAL